MYLCTSCEGNLQAKREMPTPEKRVEKMHKIYCDYKVNAGGFSTNLCLKNIPLILNHCLCPSSCLIMRESLSESLIERSVFMVIGYCFRLTAFRRLLLRVMDLKTSPGSSLFEERHSRAWSNRNSRSLLCHHHLSCLLSWHGFSQTSCFKIRISGRRAWNWKNSCLF